MSGCPNSTESGCRCPEHDPGLSAHARDPEAYAQSLPQPVRLRVVTTGASARRAPQQDAAEQRLKALRASCPVCRGDAVMCNDGTGAPNFRRLVGCRAWNDEGAAASSAESPRQPWEPRPSRAARAA